MSGVITWQQLLDGGVEFLQKAGIAEADLDAWYLLSEAFHIDRIHFFMDRNRPVFGTRLEAGRPTYGDYLERRASREPLQQILGVQDFMGLTFKVNEHVLIPRQDTEKLVEEVLKDCRDTDISVLDMCTGSGCIGISLAVLGGYEHVTAADCSPEALKVAQKNGSGLFLIQKGTVRSESRLISAHPRIYEFTVHTAGGDALKRGLGAAGAAGTPDRENRPADLHIRKFTLVESDMFSNLDAGTRYDVIVSNPPYIPSAVIDGLEPEVRDHEPRMALDGAEDGLHFYRILAAQSKEFLKDGGSVYFEIGYDQAEAVTGLLLEHGYSDVCVVKDEPGLDRVVKAVLRY